MRRSPAKRALALCVFSSVALANNGSDTAPVVRGYTLSGEVMMYSVADQHLPAGWTIQTQTPSRTVKLRGLSEGIFEGKKMHSMYSQALPTEGGQVLVSDESGNALGLGDMQVSFVGEDWYVRAMSPEMAGKPIFEISAKSRTISRTARCCSEKYRLSSMSPWSGFA